MQWWTMKPTRECEPSVWKTVGLIQQSPPSSDTWLGPFCLRSCKNQHYMHSCSHSKQENPITSLVHHKQVRMIKTFWLLENTYQFIERQNCWLLSYDGHGKCPINAGFYAVARIPNFPYVNHPGHDEIFAGLTLECIASYHTLCTSNILGMQKSGKSNEKSWTEWQRDHRKQLGRRLDACRRADIGCSLTHCWWETTCFLWSTATCIVEVISFFMSLLGCFTIKAP